LVENKLKSVMNPRDFKSEFFNLVEQSQKILISSHKNPDPDSFASVISMITFLKGKYPQKELSGMYTGDLVSTWSSMPNGELITSVDDVADQVAGFDLLIVLDVHPYDRYVNNVDKLSEFKGKRICIDHHAVSAPVDYDLMFNDPKATSVAEIIYKIFLEDEQHISPTLCESILMGILGDTMWLTVNMRAETVYIFDIVKRLVSEGNINLEILRYKTFIHDQKMFPALKGLVSNARIESIGKWPEMIVGFIPRQVIQDEAISEINVKSASNHFVNAYPKTFAGITWGISAYPLDNGGVSISLRSLVGSVNVRAIADVFGGGGHDGASSIKFKPEGEEKLEPEECLKKLVAWLEGNEPVLRVNN
jgi:phosphoesterase RecJ-like protein